LVRPVISKGKLLESLPAASVVRDEAAVRIKRLPEALKRIGEPAFYPVDYSDSLRKLGENLQGQLVRTGG
jgi:hypothetical protein